MTDDLSVRIARIEDRQAICDLIHLYCRGLDRLDEGTLKSIYHDDAVDDRGEGLFIGLAHEMAKYALDQLTRNFTASQHFIGNVLVDLQGDTAFGETYFQAYHRYADRPGRAASELIMAGRYLDRFERRDGVWKIAHRKMVNDWSRTQPVSERWMEKNPGAYRGARVLADSRLG